MMHDLSCFSKAYPAHDLHEVRDQLLLLGQRRQEVGSDRVEDFSRHVALFDEVVDERQLEPERPAEHIRIVDVHDAEYLVDEVFRCARVCFDDVDVFFDIVFVLFVELLEELVVEQVFHEVFIEDVERCGSPDVVEELHRGDEKHQGEQCDEQLLQLSDVYLDHLVDLGRVSAFAVVQQQRVVEEVDAF